MPRPSPLSLKVVPPLCAHVALPCHAKVTPSLYLLNNTPLPSPDKVHPPSLVLRFALPSLVLQFALPSTYYTSAHPSPVRIHPPLSHARVCHPLSHIKVHPPLSQAKVTPPLCILHTSPLPSKVAPSLYSHPSPLKSPLASKVTPPLYVLHIVPPLTPLTSIPIVLGC